MRRTASSRRAVVLVLLGLLVATATITTSTLLRRPDAPSAAPASAADVLAHLPVSFEPDGEGRFSSSGPGYALSLTASGATVDVGGAAFSLRPAGPWADLAAAVVGTDALEGTVSRLTGNDPAAWTTGVPTFGRVTTRQAWPGIDIVWHGNQRRLEHDVVVAPGADPAVVALDVDGARSLTIDPAGDLVLDLATGAAGGATTARLARPVVYQDVAGGRREVAGAFTLLGPSRLGFTVGDYDHGLPLVIDPTLVTSTYLGGIGNDSGYAIALDAQGNIYVTGSTESADFPTSAPFQGALSNGGGVPASDVFVSKLSPDGSKLLWSTYLGGKGRDIGYAIAVATDGSAYIGGVTESPDFPVAKGPQSAYGGGPSDAFMARIAANGTGVEWSTFIGGSQTDRGRGVAVDASGNGYLTGSTTSTDFPSLNPQQPGPFRADDLDAFLVKVPAAGTPLTYATRLGGGNDDRGLAVAVDAQSNAYVTGDTLSPGFPTVRPLQANSGGGAAGVAGSFPDAFVAKYNPNGSALIYSTFLGGSDVDQGTAIAVDGQGAVYVAGNTNSPNFPTAGALQATKGGESDAFVSKIDPQGAALVYSTYIGGSGADGANGIAVDRAGSAHVVGTTGSTNWVTAKPTQAARGGGDDAFVLKLDSTGRGPLFSTFLGGNEADSALGVALGAQGAIHVLGATASADLASVKPVQGSRPAAGGDAFVATIDPVDTAPTTVAGGAATPPASTPSSSAHDRRVRILGLMTLVLVVAAGLQTVFLRRRTPASTGPGSRAKPAPRPSASPGLKVLDGAGNPGPRKASAAEKAAAARAARAPKSRGGPKGGPAKKSAGAKKAGGPQKAGDRPGFPGPVPLREAVPAVEPGDVAGADSLATGAAPLDEAGVSPDPASEGGPPTMAVPTLPPPPKARPQAPAIAQLLEEDLWASEPPAGPQDLPPGELPAIDGNETQIEWAPFDTDSTPVVGPGPSPAPSDVAAPPIPPVPAEDLSFWDLFPEDLPPARPTSYPAEDLLGPDYLALPEGPESVAGRLAGDHPVRPSASAPPVVATPPPPPPPSPVAPAVEADLDAGRERPPHPPEAEIVIAELLDGPPPVGARPSAASQWAPQAADDDFVIDDLLIDDASTSGPQWAGAELDGGAGDGGRDDEGADAGDPAEPAPAQTPEQARIAADRARRRRSRRGGRSGRKPPTGG